MSLVRDWQKIGRPLDIVSDIVYLRDMSRTEQYNEARQNVEIARTAYNTASTKTAWSADGRRHVRRGPDRLPGLRRNG